MGEAISAVKDLSSLGLVPLLFLIIFGGYKRYWVFGWQYEEKRSEAEQWKAVFLRGHSQTDRALEVVQKVAEVQK